MAESGEKQICQKGQMGRMATNLCEQGILLCDVTNAGQFVGQIPTIYLALPLSQALLV